MTDPYLTRDDRREVRRVGWYALRWVLAVLVVCGLISLALWAFSTGTASVKGRAGAYRQKESATNRIAAQEAFESRYNDIQAAAARVTTLQAAAKAAPGDYTARVNATGAVTYCQQAVADYNAAARQYTQQDFRPANLPDTLDISTICGGQ